MEEWRRKKIEDVYAKWEKKVPKPDKINSSKNGVLAKKPLVIHSSRYSNAARNYRHIRQRLKIQDSVQAGLVGSPTFCPSLELKKDTYHVAYNLKYISIQQSCQTCLPTSRNKYVSPPDVPAGLINYLIIDKRKFGFFGRLFPYVTQVWRANVDYSLRDLRKDILQSPRVRDAIQLCAKTAAENDMVEYTVTVKEQEKRARTIIREMSSCVYFSLARVVAWALLWIYGKLYNRIHVQRKHVSMLLTAQKQGIPIVFLPGHKSHMDYIIMTFILYNMGVHIPRIAAGDNLRICLISWLVTHLGGFFIKRKLDTAAGRDVLYRKCLHEFMEHSLCDGENMEFFIEGSRSRSGKPSSPKAGLLSVLVDSVKEGVVDDILLVPVSISYDTLIERNFVRHELMGGNKKPETFCKAMSGVWSMITRNTGSIRIDFAQPFSLQEYLSSSTIATHSQLEMTGASHSRSILNMGDLAQRKVVTALSHHIVYDFTHCASLMPTNMVGFLLLTKHRAGVTVAQLISSYAWLEEEVCKKQRSVGFTGEASEAVHYALHYLKPLLIFDKSPKLNGQIAYEDVVQPRLELPDVFELLHQSNQVTPMLILEAVIACSLHSLVREEIGVGSEAVEVSQDEVVDTATYLCRILSREFIFAPPCVDMWCVLTDAVEALVVSDVLRIKPEVMTTDQGRKLPSVMENWDEEEEKGNSSICLQVNREQWALDHLLFLHSMLDPILEGYWNTVMALLQMKQITEESVFLKQLQASLLIKVEGEMLRNVESISMDILRNAVKSMLDLGYVNYKKGSLLHVVDSDRLLEVMQRIARFQN